MTEFWQYIASLGLTFSDWLLLSTVLPIGWFVFVYGFLTKWWEDALGWIILSGALGLFGVILSVIFGVFAGVRIGEALRIVLYGAILVSWIGKDIVLHRERRLGRLEKRHRALRPVTGAIPTTQGES
jgi:hypothetical protein